MAVRYFERVTSAGEKVALFRLKVNEAQRELDEDAWTDGAWKPTSRLMEYLFDGSTEVVEVAERDAMRDFPDALESRVAKEMRPTFTIKHLAGKHDQKTHAGHGHGGDLRAIADIINAKTDALTVDGFIESFADLNEQFEGGGEFLQEATDSVDGLIKRGAPIDDGIKLTRQALNAVDDDYAEDVFVALDGNGDIAGAVSYSIESPFATDASYKGDDFEGAEIDMPEMVHMQYLGTTGIIDGAGSALFGQVVRTAAREKKAIYLEPLNKKARSFWEAMGFVGEIKIGNTLASMEGELVLSADAVAELARLLND